MGKVNVVIVDATGNKEQKVGLPDDIKCGIIMVKLVEKIKLPSVGPDGNPISYKFIHKVTGRQLLEAQTLAEAGIKDGDVLRLQPEITAGAFCDKCGTELMEDDAFCPKCGNAIAQSGVVTPPPVAPAYTPVDKKIQKQKLKDLKKYLKLERGGIFAGILSIIFGIIMFFKDTGSYEYSSSYGGDAYTGIQNASAQTANNIQALSEITKFGFAFLLIVIGIIAICYFAPKIREARKENELL